MPASGHDQIRGADLGQGCECRACGRSRPAHQGPRSTAGSGAVIRIRRRRFPQSTDDPGDVGIETGQQRPPGSRTLGDDGVDRTGHSGQRVDGVEHGKHCLLVRHSHAQARPSGLSGARSSDLSQYRGQMLRVHFPQVVHPPLQSEHSVCGSVQHRRQRVRDGQTDDGRTARRVAGPWSGHGGQPSVPAEASGGLGVAEGFGPGLELLP